MDEKTWNKNGKSLVSENTGIDRFGEAGFPFYACVAYARFWYHLMWISITVIHIYPGGKYTANRSIF